MIALVIIAIAALAAALVLAYKPWPWAAPVAWTGLLLAWLAVGSTARAMSVTSLVLFGVTALIVAGLNRMLPPAVVAARRGTGYLTTGAVVGAMIGFLLPTGYLVLAVIGGSALASLALGPTPSGRALEFPARAYWRYILAKGFPAVVTVMLVAVGALTVYEYFLTH